MKELLISVTNFFRDPSEPQPMAERISPGELHLRLLEQYSPPSIVVDEEYTLIHLSPGAVRYMHMPPGDPSRDVFELVHSDLRSDLRTALSLAARERRTIAVSGVRVQTPAGDKVLRITAKPVLREDAPLRGYFLVVFDDEPAEPVTESHAMELTSPAEPEARQLAEELENLINATDIAAVFLDRSLRVKLSTPRAHDIFNLLPTDVGRKLSDITTRLVYEPLHDDMLEVLERLQTIEREMQTREGRWYLMRILPYRTTDDRIDGVAMTFHDITLRRLAERQVLAGEERLRLLIDSAVDYAIFTINEQGTIDSWNTGAERMFGYTADEGIGQPFAVLFTPEDQVAEVPAEELRTALEKGRALDERWHVRKDGTRFYCSGVTTRLGESSRLGFAKIARDLTARRQAELALTHAHADLESRVSQRTEQLQREVERRTEAQEEVSLLLGRLVTAQEDQRSRISRDLHDQLGQQLTALRLALERHREECGGSGAALDRAQQLTRDIDRALDFLAWELRPTILDDLGLAAALPRYLEEWSAHHGGNARFQTTGLLPQRLAPDVETAFYRVAQEALNNVVKHAHASRVDVVLESRDGAVTLIIEDDGVGFDLAAPGLKDRGVGLAGMRERAALIGATLQVESTPGKGTAVFLRFSLE